MLYHCDSLLARNDRYTSLKYRWLSRSFDPYITDKAYLLELTILLLTPGFYTVHVGHMLQWRPAMRYAPVELLLENYREEALTYVPRNLASITADDGRAMLQAILDGKPRYGGTIPLYATRYLQHRRDGGARLATLAQEFNTDTQKMARWWSADLFDPLTAMPRPQHLLHKQRPLKKIRRVL